MKNTVNLINVKKIKKIYNILLYLDFEGSVGDFYIFRCTRKYNAQYDRIEKSNFHVVYSSKKKTILFKFHTAKLNFIVDFLTDSTKIKFLEEALMFGGTMIQNFIVEKDDTKNYYLHIANKQDMYNQNFVLSKFNAKVDLMNPYCLCSGNTYS